MAEEREQIYAVLVALHGDTLLLPNATVAEVVSQEGVQPNPPGAADWMAGTCLWNGRRVVVVSFEALNGARKPEPSRRSRLVVLNPFGATSGGSQIALLSQGYPHLITLNRTALQKQPLLNSDRDEFVLTRVRIANTEAAVPDLRAVELELARFQDAPAPA